MVKAIVRDLLPGDIEAVLSNLREPDRLECEALFGPGNDEKVLRSSVAASTACWALEFDGDTGALFGVAAIGSMMSTQGAPWLIGTALIDKYPSAFIKLNRPYIRRMLDLFPTLLNVVDVRNTKSVAYLKRMGFDFGEPVNIGVMNMPFYPFGMGD